MTTYETDISIGYDETNEKCMLATRNIALSDTCDAITQWIRTFGVSFFCKTMPRPNDELVQAAGYTPAIKNVIYSKDERYIYICFGATYCSKNIIKYDAETFEVIWSQSTNHTSVLYGEAESYAMALSPDETFLVVVGEKWILNQMSIHKIDARSGAYLWGRYPPDYDLRGLSVAIDANNNIYTGHEWQSGSTTVNLCKWTSGGILEWSVVAGESTNPDVRRIVIDSEGNLYVGIYALSDFNAKLLKYDTNGNLIDSFAIQEGTPPYDYTRYITALVIDSDDNKVFVTSNSMRCYDANDSELWNKTSAEYIGGSIYMFMKDGYCFKHKNGFTRQIRVSDGTVIGGGYSSAIYTTGSCSGSGTIALTHGAEDGANSHNDCGCFVPPTKDCATEISGGESYSEGETYVGNIGNTLMNSIWVGEDFYGANFENIIACQDQTVFPHAQPHNLPYFKRQSWVAPRPFRTWNWGYSNQQGGGAVSHWLEDEYCYWQGKFYQCIQDCDAGDPTYEPPNATYWDEVTAPKYDSLYFSQYGLSIGQTNGEFDEPLGTCTPKYYTFAFHGIKRNADDSQHLVDGVYHAIKTPSRFDGLWRFRRYRAGGFNIKIDFELCVGDSSTYVHDPPYSTKLYAYCSDFVEDWDSETLYSINDKCKYQGAYFKATVVNTGIVPPNEDYWTREVGTDATVPNSVFEFNSVANYGALKCFFAKSNEITSAGVNDDGGYGGIVSVFPSAVEEWNIAKTYYKDDLVATVGRIYQCQKEIIARRPSENPQYWSELTNLC